MRTILFTAACIWLSTNFIFAQALQCEIIDFEDIAQGTPLDGLTIENATFSGPHQINNLTINSAFIMGRHVGLLSQPLSIEFTDPVSSVSFGYFTPFIGSMGFELDVLEITFYDSANNVIDVQMPDISPVGAYDSYFYHQLPDIKKVEIRQYIESGFTRTIYLDNISYNCPCSFQTDYSTVETIASTATFLTNGNIAIVIRSDDSSVELDHGINSQYLGTNALTSSVDGDIQLFFGRPISYLSFGIHSTLTTNDIQDAITVELQAINNQFNQNGGPNIVETIDLEDYGFGIYEGNLSLGVENITKATIRFTNLPADDIIYLSEIQAVCGCGESDYFIDMDLQGTEIFSAQSLLESESTILPSSDIDFKSGNRICLLPNFEVSNGSVFHAYISPCEN